LAERTCAYVRQQSEAVALHTQRVAGGNWRLLDMAVAAGVLIAGSLLLFPMISQSRINAQLAGCQDNLRQIGAALGHYANLNGGFFPFVPPQGKLAAAGIYGPLLVEGGFLDSQNLLCPATTRPDQFPKVWPARADLLASSGDRLSRLQRAMGGSYGYTWGYEKDGEYHGTKNRGRPTFALLADAPNLHLTEIQSANHGRRGQNVLFEDGHVQLLTSCRASGCLDDIFRNDLGEVGAGQHANDAVIASSGSRPVLQFRIRFRIHTNQPMFRTPSPQSDDHPPLVVPVDGFDD
jgi:hypothetical protein